jgi:hypothetical protein
MHFVLLLDRTPVLCRSKVTIAVVNAFAHSSRQQALDGDVRLARDTGRFVKAMSKTSQQNK